MWTGNEFKQVQLIQVMSGEQEGFLKKNEQVRESRNSYWLVGDQILMSCNKMQMYYLKSYNVIIWILVLDSISHS